MAADAIRALPLETPEAEWAAANAAIWPWSSFRRKAAARRLDLDAAADLGVELPRLRPSQALLARLDPYVAAAAGVPCRAGVDTDMAEVMRRLDVEGGTRPCALVGGTRDRRRARGAPLHAGRAGGRDRPLTGPATIRSGSSATAHRTTAPRPRATATRCANHARSATSSPWRPPRSAPASARVRLKALFNFGRNW